MNNDIFKLWQEKRKEYIFKKGLGQNFLQNPKTAEYIVNFASGSKNIIEVGPGGGILSKQILKLEGVKSIKFIEYDKDSVDFLNAVIQDSDPRVEIIHCDALFYDNYPEVTSLVSNLPYNISKQLIIKWCFIENIIKVVAMFQKEVGESILSNSGNKSFGTISVLCQSFFSIKRVMVLSPKSFFPIPSVFSTVLVFERKNLPKLFFEKPDLYINMIKNIFQYRRKKISNIIEKKYLDLLKIDYNYRPEDLTIQNYLDLFILKQST